MSDSVRQLQVLLGKAGRAGNGKTLSPVDKKPGPHPAQTDQAAASIAAEAAMPQVAPKPTKARVGELGPGRDPVGETSALSLRRALGCTFSGKIELLARQMEAEADQHPQPWQAMDQSRKYLGTRWLKRHGAHQS